MLCVRAGAQSAAERSAQAVQPALPVLASRVTEIGSSEAFHKAIQKPCPGTETGLQLIGRPKNPAPLRLKPAPTVEGLGGPTSNPKQVEQVRIVTC